MTVGGPTFDRGGPSSGTHDKDGKANPASICGEGVQRESDAQGRRRQEPRKQQPPMPKKRTVTEVVVYPHDICPFSVVCHALIITQARSTPTAAHRQAVADIRALPTGCRRLETSSKTHNTHPEANIAVRHAQHTKRVPANFPSHTYAHTPSCTLSPSQ
jgi:hypothetical protein